MITLRSVGEGRRNKWQRMRERKRETIDRQHLYLRFAIETPLCLSAFRYYHLASRAVSCTDETTREQMVVYLGFPNCATCRANGGKKKKKEKKRMHAIVSRPLTKQSGYRARRMEMHHPRAEPTPRKTALSHRPSFFWNKEERLLFPHFPPADVVWEYSWCGVTFPSCPSIENASTEKRDIGMSLHTHTKPFAQNSILNSSERFVRLTCLCRLTRGCRFDHEVIKGRWF